MEISSHEFKHQLQVIGDLLRDGNTREAQDYVTQLQGQQTSRIFAANTGNTIVDAILNEKYQRARENGIDVSYKVNDLSDLKLSTDALVVLLSNLLENAIEACCRLPEDRQIECSLLVEESRTGESMIGVKGRWAQCHPLPTLMIPIL